ncbi:hypothetical protein ABMC88_18060, partial [Sulfitobacter sp. HNIBRBA2951]|uniref:hypothetical protein n=1 Tax=Sulfitobacter aquimarinus TaxID=3158557 RepID=UPI0032DFE3C1
HIRAQLGQTGVIFVACERQNTTPLVKTVVLWTVHHRLLQKRKPQLWVKGQKTSLTVGTAKQDPGVQEGETGLAQCAGDAIADPWFFLAHLPALWQGFSVRGCNKVERPPFTAVNIAGPINMQ